MSTISTHVLDTALGRPGAGIAVSLADRDGARLGGGVTDADGRIRDLLPAGTTLGAGLYELRFTVGQYFAATGRDTFYTVVTVTFDVRAPDEHYHVPLLISPYGYSTYRGS